MDDLKFAVEVPVVEVPVVDAVIAVTLVVVAADSISWTRSGASTTSSRRSYGLDADESSASSSESESSPPRVVVSKSADPRVVCVLAAAYDFARRRLHSADARRASATELLANPRFIGLTLNAGFAGLAGADDDPRRCSRCEWW